MNLGQLLKIIRTTKGMTQKDMATLMGISQNYLSLIESDIKTPSVDRIETFAAALKISKDALIFVSSSPPKELSAKDKKDYERLQKNILSLLVFDITGELKHSA